MNYKIALVTFTALFSAATLAPADDFVNMAPLVRDFVAGSAGSEAAIPMFKFGDANGDQNPDLVMYFNVFTAGTNTKLHNTPPKRVEAPAFPCTNPDPNTIENDWTVKFLGLNTSTRIHALVTVSLGCYEQAVGWKETFRTFIYSTDASKADGATWTKVYDYDMAGFDGVDWDADGTNELMVSMIVPTDTGEIMKIIFHHPVTGAVEAANGYPVVSDPTHIMN